ncbi:MAG: VOC family protein [Alphaproteobacteria bacterium]|nr:VOC family protein [Alphaproteobacteria bacterium]MCW5739069.1 VOC family protein [Alphaproteobacteria bacterium]
MRNGIAEIDHLLTYVADLETASAAYERLGFRLTPRSEIGAMGIANRLALLSPLTAGTGNYIELMSAADRGRLPPPMAATLSGAEGVKSMVMATPDAHQAQAELVANGYPFDPPVHVRREWAIPGEGSVWPEFDVMLPIAAPLPFNLCRYFNLDLYLRPDWRTHPNGARHLLATFAVSPDAHATARYYERLFGRAATLGADGAWIVKTAAVELAIYDPLSFAARFGVAVPVADKARYTGYRVSVARLEALHAPFARNKVTTVPTVLGLAAQACGNVIEFVEAG